jgi:hypothetical protein
MVVRTEVMIVFPGAIQEQRVFFTHSIPPTMSSTTEQPTGNENKSTLAGKNTSPWTRSADFWYSDAQMVI